jgi:hypothetical protein
LTRQNGRIYDIPEKEFKVGVGREWGFVGSSGVGAGDSGWADQVGDIEHCHRALRAAHQQFIVPMISVGMRDP